MAITIDGEIRRLEGDLAAATARRDSALQTVRRLRDAARAGRRGLTGDEDTRATDAMRAYDAATVAMQAATRGLDVWRQAQREQEETDMALRDVRDTGVTSPGRAGDYSAGRSTGVAGDPPWPRTAAYDLARSNVDALAARGKLSDAGADLVSRLLDSGEERERTPAAEWAATAGDPHYLSAFRKLLRDRERGHLLWTPEESAAYRAVEAMRHGVQWRASLGMAGWVLPVSLDPAVILADPGSLSPIRELARLATTATATWRGIKSTGATAEWKAEHAEAADGTPPSSEVEVELYANSCYAQYSWELASTAEDLDNQLAELIADARLQLLHAAYISGDGTAEPQGLVTGLAGGASVITTSGTETHDSTDPYRLQAALPARYSAAAAWLSDIATANAYRQMETTNGSLLYPELRQTPAMLLGKPWHEASNMDGTLDAAATESNHVLLYGDLGRGYIVVDGVGSVAKVVDVTGGNGRPTGEDGLIVWSRHGAKVVNIDAFRLLNIPTTA